MKDTIYFEIAREYRCFTDFDYRQSFAKQDFYRKWYHTRTRHPIVSLEGMAYSKNGEKTGFELVDTPFEEYVEAEVDADAFKKTLTENDMRILTMRTQGMTYEEIAQLLGYKNHSGVLKRIQKIAAQYEAYSESLVN